MMNFRTIKDSIIEILGNASKNCFIVIGHQRQMKSADETIDINRFVQLFYSAGDFPKSSGRNTGPVQHDITFRIELTVSSPAKIDLSTLNRSSSTSAEKASALASSQEASNVADDLLDELFELVYQILMDARNYDMGQEIGEVSNRWIDQIQKDDPIEEGEYVILTGSMFLKLRTAEQIVGESAVLTENLQDIVIDIKGDDTEKTGVIVNN